MKYILIFSEILHLLIYYNIIDSDKNIDSVWKKYIINFKNMKSFFAKLISNNLEMSIIMIFNMYLTWYKCMYYDSHDFLNSSQKRDINQVKNDNNTDVETDEK